MGYAILFNGNSREKEISLNFDLNFYEQKNTTIRYLRKKTPEEEVVSNLSSNLLKGKAES